MDVSLTVSAATPAGQEGSGGGGEGTIKRDCDWTIDDSVILTTYESAKTVEICNYETTSITPQFAILPIEGEEDGSDYVLWKDAPARIASKECAEIGLVLVNPPDLENKTLFAGLLVSSAECNPISTTIYMGEGHSKFYIFLAKFFNGIYEFYKKPAGYIKSFAVRWFYFALILLFMLFALVMYKKPDRGFVKNALIIISFNIALWVTIYLIYLLIKWMMN